MNLPNTHVALIAISSDEGKTLDSRYTGKPGPKWTETSDIIGGEINTIYPGWVQLTVMARDGSSGKATGTITATADGGKTALGPLTLDFDVVAPGGDVGQTQWAGGGLSAQLLMLVKKPNA